MGLTNLVFELQNKWYLKNELMELTGFGHIDTDSQKLKSDQKFIG